MDSLMYYMDNLLRFSWVCRTGMGLSCKRFLLVQSSCVWFSARRSSRFLLGYVFEYQPWFLTFFL